MAMFPCNIGSSGGTIPHEMFNRGGGGYPDGFSFDNMVTINTGGSYTATGSYIGIQANPGSATYKITCIQPCRVDIYSTSALYATHHLTSVGEIVNGTFPSTQYGFTMLVY